jgi:18S rRNA (guanine1575-N7)-methyltransferase
MIFFSTHIIDIQTKLSERAIELLNLPDEESCLVLDIGYENKYFRKKNMFIVLLFRCGSGLSGEVLTDLGHQWVGYDISSAMLGLFRFYLTK